MKIALILSAQSGTGKSTFAESLEKIISDCVVCTADDYFLNDKGEYNFRMSELSLAHKACQKKFDEAVKIGVDLVICANTNTRAKDVAIYRKYAEREGYIVFHTVLLKTHEGADVHGVPSEVKDSQASAIVNMVTQSFK